MHYGTMPGCAVFGMCSDHTWKRWKQREDPAKRRQWRAFLQKSRLGDDDSKEVVELLASFLMPPAQAVNAGGLFPQKWLAEKGWTSVSGTMHD